MQWSRLPNWNTCRRELMVAVELVAACVLAQLFVDHWLAAALSHIQRSSIILPLTLIPDRVKLSLLLTALMVALIAYRVTTDDRFRADRGMFVLGCGVVSGFAADKLKILFGRLPPEALLTDGVHGYNLFGGTSGADSFPSSHAAIAAGIAAAACMVWPAHRRIFIATAAVVAASRFVTGAHYVSDTLLGAAVGIVIVAMMQIIFHYCGIELSSNAITRK
jgi:membrane-associated phospholipid phosphatase